MSAPSVSGNQPLLFVSIMLAGPRRKRICVSPGRPSVPEVRLPPPGQPHLFLLSVPVGLPGLPHRYLPLDPVDLHFPSDRSLPALPCHLSAPAGLPDQHHLPVPVRRLPRQGRCHRALLITLRPLRIAGLFPLWPGRFHHGGDSVYGLFRRYPALFR